VILAYPAVKLALKVLAGAVLVVILYLAVTFAQVWWVSRRDEAQPAQAIVVFGTAQYDGEPSPVLAARLDHAIDLYRRKLAPVVVVTGGNQIDTVISRCITHRQKRGRDFIVHYAVGLAEFNNMRACPPGKFELIHSRHSSSTVLRASMSKKPTASAR